MVKVASDTKNPAPHIQQINSDCSYTSIEQIQQLKTHLSYSVHCPGKLNNTSPSHHMP